MRRLLVYGLDGATLPLLERYADGAPDGALAGLLRRGRSWTLRSTMPFFTAPSWTTFMTGLTPGQHGMYHWRGRHDPALGERPLLSSAHLEELSLWSHAQRHGARVSVSNFPMQYPAPLTQGRYLCGTLAPERAEDVSWPPGLIDEVRSLVPGYRFEMDKGISYLDRPRELRDHILEIGRGHARAFVELLGVADADLAVHVATVTDRMHHFFWHHLDPGHPAHEDAPAELGDPIRDAYAVADEALGAALAAAPWDAVLVLSDHGAGRSTLAFWIDAWLVERGLARPAEDGRRVDIAGSVAYCGEEPECAVYVNRQGRDGCGVPDDEYPAFVRELRDALLGARQPSGAPALDDALLGSELFTGRFADSGPDVVLVPADGVHPRPGLDEATFTASTRLYSGHRPDGLLLAAAPGLAPGRDDDLLSMTDAFPIACALGGLPLPAGLSGTVPAPVVAATGVAHDESQPPWADRVAGPPPHQARDEQLLQRLSELGYT